MDLRRGFGGRDVGGGRPSQKGPEAGKGDATGSHPEGGPVAGSSGVGGCEPGRDKCGFGSYSDDLLQELATQELDGGDLLPANTFFGLILLNPAAFYL